MDGDGASVTAHETLGRSAHGNEGKPATAARIYDYLLGGVHNFPADRQAAQVVIDSFPGIRLAAQSNRGFLRRAVRFLVDSGVRQFLDLGSGIPTHGNVHEVAQDRARESRVVYVDIDPVAVSESLEMLEGNDRATAIRANVVDPRKILDNPAVLKLIDFDQPVAVLMLTVLHYVVDDPTAYGSVRAFVDAMAPGSFLAISHGADTVAPDSESSRSVTSAYRERTATPVAARSIDEVTRFFEGMELLDPGVVWVPQWRPEVGSADPLLDDPGRSTAYAGVGRKP